MFLFLTYPANALLGLFVASYAALTGAKYVARGFLSSSEQDEVHFPSPYIKLNVKPISEGDRVAYAFFLHGKYSAHIENKRKKAKLDFEADTKEELERMVQDTFRAWAVVGKKRTD